MQVSKMVVCLFVMSTQMTMSLTIRTYNVWKKAMFINVMDDLTDSSAVDILLVRSDTMLYYQIIVFNAGPHKTCKWYVNCIQCLVLPIYGMYRGFFKCWNVYHRYVLCMSHDINKIGMDD